MESRRQVAAWNVDGFSVCRVPANGAAQALEHKDVVTSGCRVLRDVGSEPTPPELEMTESMMMMMMMFHACTLATVVANLRGLRVEAATDDFGTGSSSPSQPGPG